AAGLANKLDAVIHILLLEVGWSDNHLDDLSSYSRQVINNCSDQGVEYEIAQAPAVDLSALLSERAADLQSRTRGTVPALTDDVQYNALCDEAAEEARVPANVVALPDEEAVAIREGAQQERDRVSRLFPNSWHTADVKHVVDNLLHEWDPLLSALRSVEKLLRWTTMRERFQACCIDPDDSRAAQLNTWSHSLVSLRWEALVDFTGGLLELEPLLRQCWSKKKFLAGSPGRRVLQAADASTGEHSTSVAVEGIDAALTSATFWTGVALCHDVAFEAEFAGRWAEGCGCCRKPNPTCAFKGCRAAEFSSGEWQQELKKTMIKNRSALGQYLVMSRDTDRAQYFSDWAKARARLWGGIQVKLGYWQQLPWLWAQGGRGRLHAQSQRFLSEEWYGLSGTGEAPDLSDPPLRGFVQRLAHGESVLQIHASAPDSTAVASLLSWLAAMRHAPGWGATV
ncbi:unnamed protein product, partial [Symbiodinium sp. CCMP2456]